MNTAGIAYRDEDIIEAPVSVSHFVGVLRAYSATIGLALAGVAIAYAIVAIAVYVFAPSQRVMTRPFSLDFPRATEGKYPNGLKFSTNEIISGPILARVYKENQLNQYLTFEQFVPCVYILESNPEYEKLQREYQARLNDPKLSSVERQQIEKDYEDKKDSLAHNLFSLNFAVPNTANHVPDQLAAKTLASILNRWADWAQNEGRITSYDVTVLSPSILDDEPGPNLVITIRILIKRLSQVLDNIDEIGQLPSASLSRTRDHLSLAELRIKIEDLIRFRLEPSVALARESRGTGDPATIQFVKSQLDYDQRELSGYQDRVAAIRDAMNLYASQRTVTVSQPQPGTSTQKGTGPTETVMPQVSDTFIDRMAQLLNQSADVQYRQRLVTQLRSAQNDMLPAQQAVRYDQQLMREITTPSTTTVPEEQLRANVEEVRAQAKALVAKVGDVYTIISQNLNPQTYLYSFTGPAQQKTQRSTSLGRLALIGVLLLLVSLPLIVMFCLLHHRVAEEEQTAHSHGREALPTEA